MPIGIGLGVAGVGAAATVGSSLINSSASSKASQAATNAANSNNALQAQIYGQNTANLTPYMQRGNVAGDNINALLGLPGSGGASSINENSSDYTNYLAANPDIQNFIAANPSVVAAHGGVGGFLQWHDQNFSNEDRQSYANAGTSENAGLNNYLNSTNYGFTYGQGLDALNQSRVAAAGGLHSGATLKAISNYGQNTAQSALGSYINYLQTQQNTGLSGANALAGVGTGYANAVSSNNNSAASATGNAALSGASGMSSALGGLSSTAGLLGSYYSNPYASSYTTGAGVDPTNWTAGL